MDEFHAKIKIAVKGFNDLKDKLSNKENDYGLYLLLKDLKQTKEILYEVFDSNIEPDSHLINYYLLIIKKKANNVNLYFADYWVYRSAIASLSKYYDPSLEMLMTQHFSSARDILDENFNGLYLDTEYETKKIIDAILLIKDNTVNEISYIGADLAVKKCQTLINESVDSVLEKLKKMRTIKIEDAIDLFSLSVLEIMIDKKCLPLI